MRNTMIRRFLMMLAVTLMGLGVFALKDAQAKDVYNWAQLKAALESDTNIVLKEDCIAGPEDGILRIQLTLRYITLDLNGHTIDRGLSGGNPKSAGYVIRNDGYLTIKDSAGGGKITGGNNADSGGGIYNCGWLYIEGGEISGNASAGWGGGIYMPAHVNSQVNLRGGVITGNTCKKNGGGIHVSESSHLRVRGKARVYGNTKIANQGEAGEANNIKLTGKEIIEVDEPLKEGAELYVSGFTDSGSGTITSGYGKHNAGQEPGNYFHPDNQECTIALSNNEVSFELDFSAITTWEQLKVALSSSGTAKLAANITAGQSDSVLTVPRGVKVELDLNGYEIDRGLRSGDNPTAKKDGYVLQNEGTLTITDSSTGKSGKITGGYTQAAGSTSTAGCINNNGTLTLNGVEISGNASTGSGGAIYNRAEVTVNGGSISNNISETSGGAIYNNGRMTMDGVHLFGNRAQSGGAIYNSYGSRLTLPDVCQLTDNRATGKAHSIYNCGTITMNSGDITFGTASDTEPTASEVICIENGSFSATGINLDCGQKFGVNIHGGGGEFRMNGGLISGHGNTFAVYMDGGGFILENNGEIDSEGSGVYVQGATFNMKSGSVTARDGHGVGVLNNGHFTMDSGVITVNAKSATANPYGVSLFNGCTFTMNGGEITGRGDVAVYEVLDNSFTMNGGSITGSWSNAVNVTSSSFTMKQVDIQGVICLHNRDDVIKVSGSLGDTCYPISKHVSGAFTSGLKGNGTEANFTHDDETYQIVLNGNGEAELVNAWPRLQAMINAAQNNATIRLESNYIALLSDGPLVVPSGKNITLDLAGYTIDRCLTGKKARRKDGYVLRNEGTLTITDSVGGGVITGGDTYGSYWTYNPKGPSDISSIYVDSIVGGGGIYNKGTLNLRGGTIRGNSAGSVAYRGRIAYGGGIFNEGTLRMSGGAITGNTASGGGGGVYNSENGTFTMSGGTISGNESLYIMDTNRYTEVGFGGGIMSVGPMTMSGGTVSGNTAGNNGGGIRCDKTLTMTGGEISGNKSKRVSDDEKNITGYGGGVYLPDKSGATLNLSGGIITRNNSVRSGGGIYVSAKASLKVSGNPVVYANGKGDTLNNIQLVSDNRMDVTGALTEGANLWVTGSQTTGIVTRNYDKYNRAVPPATYFESDLVGYSVVLKSGEASVESAYTDIPYVRRSWNGQAVVSESVLTGEVIPVPANGRMTDGWYYLDRDVTVKDRVALKGDTSLILGDGYTLTLKGLYVPFGSTLTIYSQTGGTGRIVSTASEGTGIGAYSGHPSGNIIIHGGTITATGAKNCAGIGGNDGDEGLTPDVTIYGGIVTATGGSNGAGIGGGRNCDGGYVRIYGGAVTATGKDSSAGIGSGDPTGKTAYSSLIDIFGGTVTATGNSKAAGIGGGEYGFARISISGGTVNATGGATGGAAIGTGADGQNAEVCYPTTVKISGGVINAVVRDAEASGIGNGKGTDNCTVTLDYTTITKDTIRITSPSYGGTVTLNRPFLKKSGETTETLNPGTVENNDILADSTLTASEVTLSNWAKLQMQIDSAMDGDTVTLDGSAYTHYIAGDEDIALQIPAGKHLTIDMNSNTLDRGLADASAAEENGSVIEVAPGATLTLKNTGAGSNSCITGGYAVNGGGISCAGQLIIEKNVRIRGNRCDGWGGGIYLPDGTGAELTMISGAVDNNTCGSDGGGIHVSETAVMRISGNPKVYMNRKQTGEDTVYNNVNLAGDAVLDIAGRLRDENNNLAQIYVSRSSGTGVFTRGLKAAEGDAYEPFNNFVPDQSRNSIILNDEGEALLCDQSEVMTITFLPGGDDIRGADPVSPNPQRLQVGTTVSLPDCTYTASFKTFTGWSVKIGDAEAVDKQPGEMFTVTAETTVTAVWEPHHHQYTFTATESEGRINIVAACADIDGKCDLWGGEATLTLVTPGGRVLYDGQEHPATLRGEIPGVDTPEIVYTKDGEPFTGIPKDAGAYTAGITLTGTFSEGNGEATAEKTFTLAWTIEPKEVTVQDVTAVDRDYEAGNTAVEIGTVTFDDAVLIPGEDYTVTGVMEDDQAGENKPVTVTVELLNTNFEFAGSTEKTITVTTGVNIFRIDYTGTKTVFGSVYASQETDDATATLPALSEENACYDTARMTADDTGGLISGTPTVEKNRGGWTLTYSTASRPANTVATLTIPVTGATNYNDYNVTVRIITSPKGNAGVSISGDDLTKTYGDADFTLSAEKTAEEEGTWTWTGSAPGVATVNGETSEPTVTLISAGTATITATFESENFAGTAVINLTVLPGEVKIPEAAAGLKWTGDEQTGVAAGAGYTVENGTGTAAGMYTALVTLDNPEGIRRYCWIDGTEEEKSIPWSIAKADGSEIPPAGLQGFAVSAAGESDGRIIGVTAEMEYAGNAEFNDPADCTGPEITGLQAGTYYVRVKETENREAGAYASVAVPEPNRPIAAVSAGFSGAYDGEAHGITVTVEDPASGCEIRYGTDPMQCTETESPTITNVADSPLTVYYRITANGYDEKAGSETVEISAAYPEVTPPYAVENLIYSGARKQLVTPGIVDQTIATLKYAKTTELTPPADEEFTSLIPKARDAGTWYVWYRTTVNEGYRENYRDTNLTVIAVTIYKPEPVEASFRLPAQMITIEANAFEGNTWITEVDARGCTSIGAGAFKGCTCLNQIQLPKRCVIDPTAFNGCGTVYVFAPEGGKTEESCYGIPNCVFVEIPEE